MATHLVLLPDKGASQEDCGQENCGMEDCGVDWELRDG
jgi:hypothetical protein